MSLKFRCEKRNREKIAGNQFTAPESVSLSNEWLGETRQNKDDGKQLSTDTASEENIVSGKLQLYDLKEDDSEEEMDDLGVEYSGR